VCPDVENHHARPQKTLNKVPLTLFKVPGENCIAANVVPRQPPASVRKVHQQRHGRKQKIPHAFEAEANAI